MDQDGKIGQNLNALYMHTFTSLLILIFTFKNLAQLITNGKFKSNVHRVLSSKVGPRISVAYFLSGPAATAKLYGPIKELISEENPPLYRELMLNEYMRRFASRALDEKAAIEYYKI